MPQPTRLKLQVLPGASSAAVQRLEEAVRNGGAMTIVKTGEGEVWDPVVAVIDCEHLDSALGLLDQPRFFDARLVLAMDGAAALPDDVYWLLRRRGAADLVDVSAERIDDELTRLSAECRRWLEVDRVLGSTRVEDVLVGRSPSWVRALRALIEAATSSTQPLLIHGETGTGKEAAARLVHDLGPSRGGEFVVVDCASIVDTLSGSELFGHRRGAFTGADRDREGAILRAHGGTLFLDELGELKPGLQAELLRVLQEGVFRAVGEDRLHRSDFRLVAATNRNLDEMVREGAFRSDLYYRIAAVTVVLPPLRDRRGDVTVLTRRFLNEMLRAKGPFQVDDRLQRLLDQLSYDGNVRQLRSIIQAVASRYDGCGVVGPAHVPMGVIPRWESTLESARWDAADFRREVEKAIDAGETLKMIVDACKDAACLAALRHEGSARMAARRLDVSTRMIEKRRRQEGGAGAREHPDV